MWKETRKVHTPRTLVQMTKFRPIVYQNGGFLWFLECIGIVVRGVRGAVVGCGHQ